MILLMSFVFSLSSCSTQEIETEDPIKSAETFMNKYLTYCVEERSKDIMSLFADDFVGYDSLSPGWTYNYAYAEKMNNDPNYWKSIKIHEGSAVVSQDGMFAASVSRMDFMIGK